MLIKKSYKTINSTENISEKYNKELGKLILHSGQSWGGDWVSKKIHYLKVSRWVQNDKIGGRVPNREKGREG